VDNEARIEGLRALLADTAHAHHEATGGPNANWAGWYAEHLYGRIDEYVGSSPDMATISDWMIAAEKRHEAEEPENKYWPTVYARYIVEDYSALD
jgi:hypothetical protein